LKKGGGFTAVFWCGVRQVKSAGGYGEGRYKKSKSFLLKSFTDPYAAGHHTVIHNIAYNIMKNKNLFCQVIKGGTDHNG
jgi:hypothetical protein